MNQGIVMTTQIGSKQGGQLEDSVLRSLACFFPQVSCALILFFLDYFLT